MEDILKKINQIEERLKVIESSKIAFNMPIEIRQNIQKAVINRPSRIGTETNQSQLLIETLGKLFQVPMNVNITSGSGAPTFTAPIGTIYTRTDTATVYVNSDGGTTWPALKFA